jgi:hypothetical protein
MTIGEVLKQLITAENYAEVRKTIPDNLISFIKEMLPDDYGYIEAKEESYQEVLTILKDIMNDNSNS